MAVRVVLLRAVNVGGATLPMASLRELASGLGADAVRTHIASGNLIADVPGDPDAFDRGLERAVEARHGFFREAISRTPAELAAALAAHPFEVLEPKHSHIVFLPAEPTGDAVRAARTFAVGDDLWDVTGREMHIRYRDGAGRPQMKHASIIRALAVPGTARNLTTVAKLVALTGG